jgi:protein MPE1
MRADIPAPIDLQCKICKLLLKEPVSTPCCSSLFCTECITDELVRPQSGEKFRCPQCQSTNIVPDSLVTEPEINQRVNQVTRDYISAKQKEAVESKAGLDSDENDQNDEENNSQQLDDQPIVDGDNGNDLINNQYSFVFNINQFS